MGVYPYLIYHQAISAVAEGEQPGVVYAGTDDGRIWLTKNDGGNWTEIGASLPRLLHVAKITASQKQAGRVYVVLNDRRSDNPAPFIYQSDDYGAKWKLISGNLPSSPVNVVVEHPDDANTLLCGTDMGVYISKNGGGKWMALNGNIPASVSVNDMFIHPRDKKVVIGTYGRGVYILDDINVLK
jgi:photosystem II stability/assembly factor-like uncharacterized protein